MTSVLQTSDNPSIRTLLNLSSNDFDDNSFATAGIVPVVNQALAVLIPDYSVLSASDQVFAKASGVYYAAGLTTVPLQIRAGYRLKVGDVERQDPKPDYPTIREMMFNQSKQWLMRVSTVLSNQVRPTQFIANGPTTSGANVYTVFNQWRAAIMPSIVVWASTNGLVDFGWIDDNLQ